MKWHSLDPTKCQTNPPSNLWLKITMRALSTSTTMEEPDNGISLKLPGGESEGTNQTPPNCVSAEDLLTLPNLPPEIVVEILLRLPVKSLLRFRCVCKSWRSSISRPEFVKTHLSLASKNTDYTHHRLILSNLYPCIDMNSCSLYAVLHEHSINAVELYCPFEAPHHPRRIEPRFVGCCDGLVCIAIEKEIFIWNPSTRKSKRLPNVEKTFYFLVRYGFGYDESTGDYKVVGFFRNLVGSGSEAKVKVYTLRSDSWREIGDFPLDLLTWDGLGAFVNGALHWALSEESTSFIVSLDLAKEMYGKVLLPEIRDCSFDETVLVLNGCLSILIYYDNCVAVWVMKEYGIRESWTKLVVIPYVSHLPMTQPEDLLSSTPVCILQNGEVLIAAGSHLVWYNPRDDSFRYPTIHNCSASFHVYSYVESLVSPDFDADSEV